MRLALGVLWVVLAGCHPAATQARDERAPSLPSSVDAGPSPASAGCSRDVDCALTHRLPNCCTGCAPRALPVSARASLEARCRGHDTACIEPLCRAPSAAPVAVCVQGRCDVRRGGGDRR